MLGTVTERGKETMFNKLLGGEVDSVQRAWVQSRSQRREHMFSKLLPGQVDPVQRSGWVQSWSEPRGPVFSKLLAGQAKWIQCRGQVGHCHGTGEWALL
jgi:hypothetical protein